MRRPSLSVELLLALVLPAAGVLLLVATRADAIAARALESALAERLLASARVAAAVVSPRVAALGPGDEDSRTHRGAVLRLEELAVATGVGALLVLRAEDDTVILDPSGVQPIGAPYPRAEFDRVELERVRAGEAAAALLFFDETGKPYKSGYAPMLEGPNVVAYVAAVAPADYNDALTKLRGRLLLLGGAGLTLLAGAALGVAALVTRPLARLSAAARAIGAGELDQPVPRGGPAEAAVLGETMASMARSLKAREEELQLMLAGIAHEVRNPLGGIELFGGLLKEDLAGDPRQKHVDKILRELGVLARVVTEFLDYARRRPPDRQPVRLPELFSELAGLLDPKKRLSLGPPAVDVAHFDREVVQRALLNLLQNGLHAAASEVRLTASAEGDALVLLVDDDGPGIPEADRDRIFAPFFTTKQRGTGLGLALVRRAAEAHGGEARAEPSPLGGARLRLVLPGAVKAKP